MASSLQHRQRLYLHPQKGWRTDSEDAIARLDSEVRSRSAFEGRNRLYREDGRGGWSFVGDASDGQGEELALLFQAWITAAEGERYLAVKGTRVVDNFIASTLLAGLQVRDEDGREFSNAQEAGQIFLLDGPDATEFIQRVPAAGGRVERSQPLPDEARTALAEAEEFTEQAEALAEADERAVEAANTGDLSGAPEFEGRGSDIHLLGHQVRAAESQCRQLIASLTVPGRAVPERAEAEALLANVELARARTDAIVERRNNAERTMARAYARNQGQRVPASETAQRLLLFREFASIAAAQGWPVEQTPEGARVHTPRGVLELGSNLCFTD